MSASSNSNTSEFTGVPLQDQNGNLLPFIHPESYGGSSGLQRRKVQDYSMQLNAEANTSSSQFPSDDIPVQPSTRKYSVSVSSKKVHLFSCFKLQSTKPKSSLAVPPTEHVPNVEFNLEGSLDRYRKSMDVFIKAEAEDAKIKQQHEKIKENILQVSPKTILESEKLEAYVELESWMNCQLLKHLRTPPSTFGIYITETRVVVATVSSGGDVDTICDISGRIRFLEDNIIIGIESTERNSLSLHSLIKSSVNDRSTIMFGSLDFTFDAEEMLTLFFLKLYELLQKKLSGEVTKVVIITPFTISSPERKRIERASKVFNSVTIVSTLFIAALEYARQTGFFLRINSDVISKFILAVQYCKNSFLIALLELGHNFVFTKNFVTSSQACGSFNGLFTTLHEKIIGGESLSKKELRIVRKAYFLAVKKTCKDIKRSNISAVVVTNPQGNGHESAILDVFKKVLSGKNGSFENFYVSKEPIRMASLWAFSSAACSATMPADVDVYDISNLLVSEALGSANSSRKSAKVNKAIKLPADFACHKET